MNILCDKPVKDCSKKKLSAGTPMSTSRPLNYEFLTEEDCRQRKESKNCELIGFDEIPVRLLEGTEIPSSVSMSGPSVVPENFGIVYPNIIFRSSCPSRTNFAFLESLFIRTIVSLRQEEYTDQELEYMATKNIKYYHFGMPGSKYRKQDSVSKEEGNDLIDIDILVKKSLYVILNKEFWPVLLHCSGGKHRTGIVVGSLRALMGWSVQDRIDEYVSYSYPKEREVDKEYIRDFTGDPTLVTLADELKKNLQANGNL
ncbi:phosphoprotein phosphatase [Schizosaccharomyces octosporus yFS286]|uniref:Phosphoprotein phosphatase n=1 Tax=Schizosaccharomyces octosporus (strain yFS286) TaxID=483514 RepID=S9PWD6_SCHOY|nr:phosphoprotein phosphatase [Schizosaccharomyces octosporus yFS286]EPX72317.1 phosphoprotein phosphatase [Schizosaccharomyces octosporus yFS286]